jgi:hypothetical protein
MLKKLIVTAAAAVSVSVPLAGVAGADAGGEGIGSGGIPGEVGATLGSVVSDVAQLPGSVPDVVKVVSGGFFTAPGEGVKNVTPGTGNGVGPSP